MLIHIVPRSNFVDSAASGHFDCEIFSAEFFDALWTLEATQFGVNYDRREVRVSIIRDRRVQVLVLAIFWPRTYEGRYGQESSTIDVSSEKADAQRMVWVIFRCNYKLRLGKTDNLLHSLELVHLPYVQQGCNTST